MLSIECHCGRVKLTAAALPASLTRCNCSICERLGARWAYFDAAEVTFASGNESLDTYSWGERSIIYHRCSHCGCVTHYTGLLPDHRQMTALNCRMAAASAVAQIPVRRFDGRDSWRYFDE